MNNRARDFYVFSYFGYKYDDLCDDKENAVYQCAYRAYLDFNRTIDYYGVESNSREKLRSGISDYIRSEIKKLLGSKDEKEFDDNHELLCSGIINKSEEQDVHLCYGQAQKWLNMTLKYMMLLDIWDELKEGKELHKYLHIPVDRMIIKAVWSFDKILLPYLKENYIKNLEEKYPCDRVKPWSLWNENEYCDFQISLRNCLINESDSRAPIDWECDEWINQASNNYK